MTRRIVIRVRRNGSVSAETREIFGDDCLDYIPVIEQLTDASTVESHFTADYHAAGVDAGENLRQRNELSDS